MECSKENTIEFFNSKNKCSAYSFFVLKLLGFQFIYMYSDGNSEEGFRFIWRRPDGHLQAARGQARIPERKYLEELTKKAEAQGWY